jgi:hypothetical protein
MFCFCSFMTASNDNGPKPEGVRLLPVAGRVSPRGAVVFELELRPAEPVEAPGFPNDPREA